MQKTTAGRREDQLRSKDNPNGNLQVISRRRTGPGSRAIVGGLLIALAALGTFLTAGGGGNGTTRPSVVAARDLPPGTVLTPSDLATMPLSVGQQGSIPFFSSQDRVLGSTTLGPLRKGEFIQPGNLLVERAGAGMPVVSLSLPSARALAGDLRGGETVNILTTTKNSSGESARVAVAGAKVLKVSSAGSGAFGSSGDVILTLGVADPDSAAALVGAADSGAVTVVRATGLPAQTTSRG